MKPSRFRNLSERRDELALKVREEAPRRLDLYVKQALGWRSRTRIQSLIRAGSILLNGRPVKPSQLVRQGDEVKVLLSHGTGIPTDYEERKFEILYEDPWLLIINKPPGILVHPVGKHVYDTVMNYLHYRYREVMNPESGIHLRLCHRIDQDTSGVLVIGKEEHSTRLVHRQFESRLVSKTYVALASGHLPDGLEEIDRPLREGRTLKEILSPIGAKPSITRIKILEKFTAGGLACTWLAAKPITGRQNQIRAHLTSIGHPLVGDVRLGGPPAPPGFPRRFILHAQRLRFYHPRRHLELEIEAPLPEDVKKLVTVTKFF
ncbi:MAG: RluA family pseudouridine synthase [Planctomycetes bacterium]|nr:RluA family pseudouridine synthase [Planctomycetota bacterium]